MEQTEWTITIDVTEGEYGSLLEMLYYTINVCRHRLEEYDSFEEVKDYYILQSIWKHAVHKGGINRSLVFSLKEDIPCLVKYMNRFMKTVIDKETIKELSAVKQKLKEQILSYSI